MLIHYPQRTIQFFWSSPFVRNVCTLQCGGIINMGIGAIRSFVFPALLGISGWGKLAVITVCTGSIVSFFNFGQNQAAITYFAEAYAKKNRKEMIVIMQYMMILTSISILCALISIIIAPLIAQGLYKDPSMTTLLQLSFLAYIINAIDGIPLMLLQVTRKITLLTVLETTKQGVQVMFSLCLYWIGLGIPGVLIGVVIGAGMMLCIDSICILSMLRKEKIQLHIAELVSSKVRSIQPFVKQGLWIAIDKNMGALFPQGFIFIVSLMAPKEVIGILQLSVKFAGIPGSFLLPHIGRMASSVLPAMYAQNVVRFKQKCISLLKHTMILHTGMTIAACVILPKVIEVFYGPTFSAVTRIATSLMLILLLSGMNVLNSPLIRFMKKAHVAAVWNMISVPIELGCLWFLLKYSMHPYHAFIFAIGLNMLSSLWLNIYIYKQFSSRI